MARPQGVIDRTTKLMTAPLAPRRPDLMIEPTGNPAYDRVGAAISLARVWFRSLSVTAFTASDLVEAADLMLKAEREAQDEAKRGAWESENKIEPPGQPHPAPGNARRAANPSAKKEPT